MKIYIGIISIMFLIFSQRVVAGNLAPTDSVGIKTIKGQNFLLYKVEQGEGWYGIARKFGMPVKDVEAANEDVKKKSLSAGQILLIPTNKSAARPVESVFWRTSTANAIVEAGEKAIYYEVGKGETLYSIALKNGQTMQAIRHWNNLKSDNLKEGQKLIVGYGNKKKETPKPITVPVNKPTDVKTDSLKKDKAEWKQQAGKGTAIEEHGIAAFIEDQDINPDKYYALHRTAPKGTIIRVTNIMNKKQIFVKVIGELPDTGDNNDIIIKISKAGAKKLNVFDSRFQMILNYYGE